MKFISLKKYFTTTIFAAIIIVSLSYSHHSFAETATSKKETLDKKKWQQLTDGVDYRDDVKEEQKKRRQQMEQDDEAKKIDMHLPAFLSGDLFRYGLIVLVAVALLFFILRAVLANYAANVSVKNEFELLNEIEENLLESDIDRFIRKAIDEKNYRLAVRLYYLKIIKELSLKNRVQWKKDKTNYEYIYELSGWNNQPDFKLITRNY